MIMEEYIPRVLSTHLVKVLAIIIIKEVLSEYSYNKYIIFYNE